MGTCTDYSAQLDTDLAGMIEVRLQAAELNHEAELNDGVIKPSRASSWRG